MAVQPAPETSLTAHAIRPLPAGRSNGTRRIVIYNQACGETRLARELDRYHCQLIPLMLPSLKDERHRAAAEWIKAQRWEQCAMEEYAVHFGDWSPYTWQPFNGGHRPRRCRAVIERLHEMAEGRGFELSEEGLETELTGGAPGNPQTPTRSAGRTRPTRLYQVRRAAGTVAGFGYTARFTGLRAVASVSGCAEAAMPRG
ncbi:hypothetical protein NX794_30935 [Streptomyces sp. LP11]|uniref:Uncharacterized protein n=1 Tax=Streptomyces pyxinicus TaxID=2970331 RepID=A0ABT2BAP0_9ACTN|nr:hypothetical protein [Streptomyces sp. LP11]MCS0605586.1 hypothetical protein [Streptomyces sp. LP11]